MVTEPPGGSTAPWSSPPSTPPASGWRTPATSSRRMNPPRYTDAVGPETQLILGDFASVSRCCRRSWAASAQSLLPETQSSPPSRPAGHTAVSAAHATRHGIARAWSGFFAESPLVLSPASSQLPVRTQLGRHLTRGCDGRHREATRPMIPANLIGLPVGMRPHGPRQRLRLADRRPPHRGPLHRRPVPRRRRSDRKDIARPHADRPGRAPDAVLPSRADSGRLRRIGAGSSISPSSTATSGRRLPTSMAFSSSPKPSGSVLVDGEDRRGPAVRAAPRSSPPRHKRQGPPSSPAPPGMSARRLRT